MVDKLKALAKDNGDRLAVVPIVRIEELQAELANFCAKEKLNEYQKWIFDEVYRLENIPAHMQSVIIVAIPRPAYARATFVLNGKEYKAYAPVSTDIGRVDSYIEAAMKGAGYDTQKETRLPSKRIAVQSGLAEYGRNNIVYVEGMGSALALRVYSTEMPCAKDAWRRPVVATKCDTCELCIKKCPAGAINHDNFLVNSEKCMVTWQQRDDDFPGWMPDTAHHTPYYCFMCQARCPMNADQKIIESAFSEKETARLLEGGPFDDVDADFGARISLLMLDSRKQIPRNLRVLFDAMDRGHTPTL